MADGNGLPPLTFSFAPALQQPALENRVGDEVNWVAAHQALLHRPPCNAATLRATTTPEQQGASNG